MDEKILHVVYLTEPSDGWTIIDGTGALVAQFFPSQSEAIAEARRRARNCGGALIDIRDAHGKPLREFRYDAEGVERAPW